jgi:altronate dehydratase small subunit
MAKLIAIKISDKDNVATVFSPGAKAGDTVTVTGPAGKIGDLTILDDIPYGHKTALWTWAAGTEIVKFGEVIGKTSAAVKKGAYVHVHNLDSMGREEI